MHRAFWLIVFLSLMRRYRMRYLNIFVFTVLSGISMMVNAEALGGYVGGGLGIPSVAYGSSSLAYKVYGGYKVYTFDISKVGKLDLAVQGEYINFGSSSFVGNSWTQSGIAAAAVASWVIPRKWAGWADEKLAVLVKAGVGKVDYGYSGFNNSSTGITQGVGAEYRFIPAASVRATVEYYPGSYNVFGVSGQFNF
jgi:hypothetical protein